MQNLLQQFQTALSKKQKTFSGFFIAFLKCAWNLDHFQKTDEYPGLIFSEIIDTYTSKRSCLRTPFANERVNGFQTLLKSARHHYYSLFSSIRGKLSWKKSPSVWHEILRLLVNALSVDYKYSGSNMQNLPQQFQTPLSQKQKTFSWFFIAFLKCAWNLEHLRKKNEYPSLIISKIIHAERLKRLKGLASKHHSLMNVLTRSKHCWNQHGTTITLFSRPFEENWAVKSHLQSDMKS